MITVKVIFSAICFYFCFICYVQSKKDDIKYWESKTNPNPGRVSSKWPKSESKIQKQRYSTRFTQIEMLQEENKTQDPDTSFDDDDINEYLSPYTIKQQLTRIAKKIEHAEHANVTVEVIGRTAEYNDIVLLKMKENVKNAYFRNGDNKYEDNVDEKKIIFIVHGLSVMGVKHLSCFNFEYDFLTLVSYYTHYLDYFDIYLIPMANPDGLAMSKTVVAWNKNAALQGDCAGVALDRNFDVAWRSNRSLNSCNQEYPGPVPFSEVETRAIRDVFHKYSHRIVAYLNVHSGTYHTYTFKGDAVLYPKGYTDSGSDDDKYIDLRGEIEEAIRNATFRVLSVTVDTLYNWYGKVTGSSVDYASTVYGVPFALELVMQLYKNKPAEHEDESPENFAWNALVEVWGRVIEVIFQYISKTLDGNDV